jgi:hypothetical protein
MSGKRKNIWSCRTRINFIMLLIIASPVIASDIKPTDTSEATLCKGTEKYLELCHNIIQLARTEPSQQKVNDAIDTILSPISGVGNNLYLAQILSITSKRFSPFVHVGFRVRSACDYAILKCSWNIACSDQKGSAEALVEIKEDWRPDAMNRLLFHNCELKQQHKPTDAL